MNTALLVIDPQNDFMDSPAFQGSLAVPGAYADMQRLTAYMQKVVPDAIFITMDTHAKYDISHAMWWVDAQGQAPSPFTIITPDDVASGTWKASDPAEQEYSEFYVNELASKGKYPLCVWPYHCINGTEGHKMEATFSEAVQAWETATGKKAEYIYKGMNPKTEHYSGLKAEVTLDDDEDTQLNTSAISKLSQYDSILVAGEAQSHCVFSTTMDLLENIGSANVEKITLLTDCMSSVPSFEKNGADFLVAAQEKGANLLKVESPSNQMKM
jgi:nicotinamidase/pyrazinamidase